MYMCPLKTDKANKDHRYQSGFVAQSEKVGFFCIYRPLGTRGAMDEGTELKLLAYILTSEDLGFQHTKNPSFWQDRNSSTISPQWPVGLH